MNNRLLLDTCAVIWMATDDSQMRDAARHALHDAFGAGVAVGVSPITAWELGLLSRRGRLPAPIEPVRLFERFTNAQGISLEPLSPAILIDSSFLPGEFHSDPADRIIVATARALELTVVTRDRAILAYAKQGYVRALAC
jgi:PIN domain nuclease of toxin-antitoxin system